jgi:hypothetical protein
VDPEPRSPPAGSGGVGRAGGSHGIAGPRIVGQARGGHGIAGGAIACPRIARRAGGNLGIADRARGGRGIALRVITCPGIARRAGDGRGLANPALTYPGIAGRGGFERPHRAFRPPVASRQQLLEPRLPHPVQRPVVLAARGVRLVEDRHRRPRPQRGFRSREPGWAGADHDDPRHASS